MAWLFFAIALACLALVFGTGSVAIGAFCALLSLVSLLVGMMMFLSARRSGPGGDR